MVDASLKGEANDDEFGERTNTYTPKLDGTIVLLRPTEWLEHQFNSHGQMRITVPECGVDGLATVLDILPCPELAEGNGSVVTGTFEHESTAVVNIAVDGQEDIGSTPNHPFYSEDRNAFVAASKLNVGERVRMIDGSTQRVKSITSSEPSKVYNVEVHGTHVYYVGEAGVLVHNSGLCPPSAVLAKTDVEVYYRSMDTEHYNEFVRTGKMPASGQTTISPTRPFRKVTLACWLSSTCHLARLTSCSQLVLEVQERRVAN